MTLRADDAADAVRALPFVEALREISPAPGGKGTLLLGYARDVHGEGLRFAVFVGTTTAEIRKRALLRSSEFHTEFGNWSFYTEDFDAAREPTRSRKAAMSVRIEDELLALTPNVPPGV